MKSKDIVCRRWFPSGGDDISSLEIPQGNFHNTLEAITPPPGGQWRALSIEDEFHNRMFDDTETL